MKPNYDLIANKYDKLFTDKDSLKELPVIISENTDRQNQTDRIYDNATSELSEWDIDKLSLEIKDLDFDIEEIHEELSKLSIYSDSDLEDKYSNIYDTSIAKEGDFDGKEEALGEDRLIKYVCTKCGEDILVSRNEVISWK